MHKEFLEKNKSLISIFIIYLIAGTVLLYYYQYQINDDGIVYITIADRYIQGNWGHVINSVWAPLLSWILVPFLLFAKTNFDKIILTKIASLGIGCFTLWGIYLLSSRFKLDKNYKAIVTAAMIPVVLLFSLQVTNPDLLIATLLIFYLYFIFDENYHKSKHSGTWAGFFGGLAYLAKAYAFPFFLAHFTLFNILNFKKNKKNVFKNFCLGLLVFFLITGAWISIISEKNDKLTVGSDNGGYLYQYLIGPNAHGHPMDYQGLFKPPYNDSYSILEDSTTLVTDPWNPFNSWYNFKFLLGIIYNNLIEFGKILIWSSLLSFVIIAWAVVVAYKKKDKVVINTLLTILIYVSGYLLFLMLLRYFVLVYILLFLLGVYLLNNLGEYSFKFDKRLKSLLILILIVSFCMGPVINIYSNLEQQEINKQIFDLSQIIANEHSIHGNIASNDYWRNSHYISYYLNSRYYGAQQGNDVNRYLVKNNINYFLAWGDTGKLNLSSYEKVAFFEDTPNERILFLTGSNLTIFAKK